MTTATVARGTMPVAGHLREASRRGTRAVVALLIGVAVGFWLSDQILEVLRSPIEQIAQSQDASLNYDTVTGAFDLKLKIALFAGVIGSSPVWLAELFGYATPGLTRRERRYTVGFLAAAIPLFAAGCAFGFLLFPHMVEMLAGFSSTEDSTILNAGYYVDFVMKMVLAIGVAFVLPVFVVVLNLLGLLPSQTLWRSWRAIVVVIVLFSALVTPAADVLSMFLVAAPMAGLFTAAVIITHLHDRRKAPPCSA
ncbi:twin-arginine translocase subunit TatC [Nocardioides luteus]|uniref:Sec-independent protein translocase protein TatC n=1 Tax=Nocardioides luteus TaxID=1844 RepID=A0A1J4MWZ7_9ACTN|nr:twin-arginine translocase subunit TatC [Nocardioides luteus]OIJ23868.1 twin arginine-targeting protein translocase TatC [Nocardioides luteus]